MSSSEPKVLSIILGGGKGSRLYPLTKQRAKPAVPVAGKYRLIDIPISNCINSNLKKIYVLTQFLSVSLHRHIANTYKFDMFSKGFVEILAAQQAYDENIGWYQGTADAGPGHPAHHRPAHAARLRRQRLPDLRQPAAHPRAPVRRVLEGPGQDQALPRGDPGPGRADPAVRLLHR